MSSIFSRPMSSHLDSIIDSDDRVKGFVGSARVEELQKSEDPGKCLGSLLG